MIEQFDPNISTKAALDALLVGLRTNFEMKNPRTEQLTWYVFLFTTSTLLDWKFQGQCFNPCT